MKYEDQITAFLKHIGNAQYALYEAHCFSEYLNDDIKDKCLSMVNNIDKLIQDIKETTEYKQLIEKR